MSVVKRTSRVRTYFYTSRACVFGGVGWRVNAFSAVPFRSRSPAKFARANFASASAAHGRKNTRPARRPTRPPPVRVIKRDFFFLFPPPPTTHRVGVFPSRTLSVANGPAERRIFFFFHGFFTVHVNRCFWCRWWRCRAWRVPVVEL